VDSREKIIRYLLVVGGAALAAALVMVFVVFRQQELVQNTGDPYRYGAIARGFLEHGFDKLTRRAASLYPHLLAVIYWLGGGQLVIQLVQSAFHVGTCSLAFALGNHLFNARTGLLAGLACAVHPMLIRYVPDLHMESMLTFLCTLTVWFAVRFHEEPNVKSGIVLGTVGMVTTLTKGVLLPYLVAFGAVELVIALRRGARASSLLRNGPVAGVVAMGLAMALLLAPWTHRNYRVTGGKIVLLTPGSSDSFLRGYIFTRLEFATLRKEPYTYAENESNELFARIAQDAGTTWELDEVVDEANNARVVKERIRNQPLDTLRKCVVGLFTFWYEMTNLKNSIITGLMALGGWVLAVFGIKRARREGRPSWLLFFPIVLMNVFVAILIPLGRYSAPILPCLMVLAAFGLDTLVEGARSWSIGSRFKQTVRSYVSRTHRAGDATATFR
jgi:4-amino-4-deoxy-L-arabinose transferase-like glycosyltransferase